MKCSKCGADNLPEAKFCEACGAELGATEDIPEQELLEQTDEDDGDEGEPRMAKPGSLRDEIPFLTGAVDQAKARLEGWQQKSARKKTEKLRQKEFKRQEAERKPEVTGSSFGSRLAAFLVGLLALAAFLYLLLNYPRRMSPAAAWSLAQDLCNMDLSCETRGRPRHRHF